CTSLRCCPLPYTTLFRSVGWVGHSQGAGTLFALLSLKPEYARSIRPFIAWAPSVFTHHASSIVSRTIAATYPLLQPLGGQFPMRSEEHTSELQSRFDLVC